MTLKTFFEKFDLFADAPDAVAKMRELVMGLAIQGKLVDRIRSEGLGSEILGDAGVTETRPEEAPKLPAHWVWAELGSITTRMDSGWSPACLAEPSEKKEWGVLKTTAVQPLKYQEEQNKGLPPNLTPRPEHEVMDGDILFTRAGPMNRVGILCVARPTRPKLMISDKIIRFHLIPGIDPDFAALAMNAGYSSLVVEGLKSGMAASQVNISQPKLRSVSIPIPPLAEQKRIVAKVDELMALCDRLEAQQQEREEQASQLVRASLARFADAPTPANLPFLFHPSYAIPPADLRKSILTLAVQGKLVPQDPNDDAVKDSVRASRKKAGLAVRPLTELASDEAPFEAPESWRWVTVADVANTRLGKMLDKEKNRGEAHPYLRNTNVHWFRFELESIKTMLFASAELDEYRVEPGDVLICEGGHGIARSAVWEGQIPGIMFQKALHRVRPLSCLNGHFLSFCLWVYERDEVLQRYYTGAGIPHFTGKALARVTFPLPPLAEQRRIVAKVEQLMALVDALETQLAASRATAANLLSALVAELTTA